MPTFVVTGPDGKRYRVSAPAGASEDEVLSRVRSQGKPKDTRPTSFWQGVKEGAAKPWFNASRLMETMSENLGDVPKTIGDTLTGVLDSTVGRVGEAVGILPPKKQYRTVGDAETAFKKRQATKPVRPSKVGEFVGNIAGTLPSLALPGGPFAQGAYQTGLLTDSRDPDMIAAEMVAGGALSKVGDKVVRGIANRIAPKASNTIGQLASRNVRLTPGQVARDSDTIPGRMISAFEDVATSLPGFTGQRVRAARRQASEDFVKGAVNESLGEIGQALPKGIQAGNDAVAFAQKAASSAYDNALTGMNLIPDQQLVSEIDDIANAVRNGGISDQFANQFNGLIENVVLRRARANGGNLSGDSLKTVLSELNQKASKFGKSSVASEQEYGSAISALSDALEGAARRSSPRESVAALDAADRAYAKLVRVEGAARNASGGMFTPGQLETSIRQADQSVRKRAVAAGNGLMQDYAQAGRALLPSDIGDSGTAGREAMWSVPAWMIDLAAYAPYRTAQALTPQFTSRQPGAQALTIADLLNRSAPAVSKTLPALGYTSTNER